MNQGLCPNCGTAVNLSTEQTRNTCAYCSADVTRPEAEARFAEVKVGKAGDALLIAGVFLADADYEKALGFYDKARQQDEKSAEAWAGRAICLLHILAPHESGQRQINAVAAISSWESAIQCAANPEAVGRRAARVIADVALRAPHDPSDHVTPAIYHHLLSWALNKDPHEVLTLAPGATYYSWKAPFVELWTSSTTSNPSSAGFCADFAASHVKFLQGLRAIDPARAQECDVNFVKAKALALQFQTVARETSECERRNQQLIDDNFRLLKKRVDNAADSHQKVQACEAMLKFLDSLPEGYAPSEISEPQPEREPKITTSRQTTHTSNPSPPAPDLHRQTQAFSQAVGGVWQSLLKHLTPVKIFLTTEEPFKPLANPPKKIPTALCAIFLGGLGVHKFMLGYNKQGILQLIAGVLCLVSWLVGLVEGIIYLTKSDEEFSKTYLQAKRAWF